MSSSDCSAEGSQSQVGFRQRLFEPRPADVGKNRVTGHFRLKGGLGEDDNSPLTFPGVLALGVVE